MYRALETRIRAAGLLKTLGVQETLMQIRNIKSVRMQSGKSILLELTKKQKQIYAAVGVDLPK